MDRETFEKLWVPAFYIPSPNTVVVGEKILGWLLIPLDADTPLGQHRYLRVDLLTFENNPKK